MITSKMRADLAGLGYTPDQITNMTPAQAWEALGGMPQAEQPETAQEQPTGPATPLAYGAAALRKLIDGQPLNGHGDSLGEPYASLAQKVEACPRSPDLRGRAFDAALSSLDPSDAAAIRAAVFAADPAANLDDLAAQTETEAQDLGSDPGELQTDDKIHLTDMGNSRRFAQQHAGKIHYTEAWAWLVWSGKKWEQDDIGRVWRRARQTVKSIYKEAESALDKAKAEIRNIEQAQEKGDIEAVEAATKRGREAQDLGNKLLAWALKSQGTARIDAMLKQAKSEPEIATRPGEFDRSPWLLNVRNGILDLRTGNLKPHDPGAKLTKIAGAAYDPAAKCPTWQAFLTRIFDGNQELIDFLQRAAGYTLTGDVGEQCLFFLYGTGANGKSTFTGALQDVLGDYAMKTRAETLMLNRHDAIPEEIAQLAGVRFMLAAELGEGQKLNESLIKDLTGGDKLRGRLLYQKSFEYYPIAKPWLYGNHKPIIRGTDEGIWRRPKLIPFLVTIPESERDRNLPEKLRVELPGILTWAVQGCIAWQRGGLRPPGVVIAATDEFRNEQDVLAAFLADCCIINSLATVTAGELYQAYKAWAQESGLDHPLSKIAFSRQLGERGYRVNGRQPGNGRAYYQGLGLLKDDKQPENL